MATDPWDTTTGLLDDFDLEIEEVWFGTSPEYQNGTRLLLNLRGPAFVDGDLVEPEFHQWLSCGDKWEAVKGGEAAEHVEGKINFNRNSAVGRIIEKFKTMPDAMEILRARGVPTEAATWQGLRIHFNRVKVSEFRDRATDELIEVIQPLPTTVEEIGKGKAKGKGKGKAKGKPSLRDRVVKFAAGYDEDDYEDFVSDVVDPDEFKYAEKVKADSDLYDEVLDEDSDLWEEAHA